MSSAHHSVPLAAYTKTNDPESPWVLSYFAQRRIAGWIGIFLPVVVLLITSTTGNQVIPDSISASYYTFARNYFVSSLCAVAIFLISGVGYDEDRLLSFFAGAMAFLVAFSPCTPPQGWGGPVYLNSPKIHGTAAILLFLDFAWICLTRFTRTGNQQNPTTSPETLTPRKRVRNSIYRICGTIMVLTMATDAIIWFVLRIKIPHLTFAVEWICLWAFGFAWLVKGQQLLADTQPQPAPTPVNPLEPAI